MKFKSGSINMGSASLGRALLISLLLHFLLLWQSPASLTSGLLLAQSSSRANLMRASLRFRIEQPRPATVADPPPAAKLSDIPPAKPPSIRQPAAEFPAAPHSGASETLVEAEASGLDADGLRQYRLDLAAAARRFKRYPSAALDNAWSGTAEVVVAIDANGAQLPVRLQRSSGHALLDAAALEMMGNAALSVPVPTSLRSRTFSVVLPVIFDLNDGG